ncbi:MAG TPA: hypothetical protein GX518_02165 [Firmicutes bacterium]|nr:hypothetical protein [Bacillota bacterium]
MCNLKLEDVKVSGKNYVGGLVGWNQDGTIENCSVSGTVSGERDVGGLVGANSGIISACSTLCQVQGSIYLGGLAGSNFNNILSSFATGPVTGGEHVGGLVGYNDWVIGHSYATGSVKGNDKVGGLAGSSQLGHILVSYATGPVAGTGATGGLIGYNEKSLIYQSYYDRETTGQGDTGKGEPRSTTEMQLRTSYPKWDFVGKWAIEDGAGYPLLRWQEEAPQGCFYVVQPAGSARPGVEFPLELEAGKGKDGAPLEGPREVTVLCETDGEVVFQGEIQFTAGEAQLPITLDSPGLYQLRVHVADLPFSELLMVDVAEPEYAGGSGTVDDPYLIATARHLDNVRYNLTASYKLIRDIDLDVGPYNEGKGWRPIGTMAAPFTGSFDGNGKTIRGLYINREDEDDIGLFGVTGRKAHLYNLKLEDIEVKGRYWVGGLVGWNSGCISSVQISGTVSASGVTGGLVGENDSYVNSSSAACDVISEGPIAGGLVGSSFGEITGSSATGLVVGGKECGGLLGYNDETASVVNCYAAVQVEGSSLVGGLVGNNLGKIITSYATGSIAGEMDAGGFVGYNDGNIAHCYAAVAVTGEREVGGFVGYNEKEIVASYATGTVTGSEWCGGFAGVNEGVISNSYYDSQTTGRSQADNQWGIPKTTAEMKRQSTFAGWDFKSIWRMVEGLTYPRLHWEDWAW